MSKLTRLDLWQVAERVKPSERIDRLSEFVQEYFQVRSPSKEWQKETRLTLSRFLSKCSDRRGCHSSYKDFRSKCADWLAVEVSFLPDNDEKQTTKRSSSGGRPKKDFDNLSKVAKLQNTQELRQKAGASELSFAAHTKLKQVGQNEAATVVKKAVEASPRTLQVLFAFVQKSLGNTSAQPKLLTPEEALAHHVQCQLTKEQYIYNRQNLLAHNHEAFPPYDALVAYKKANCYPDGTNITEVKASVSLQNLVDHTAKRLVILTKDVLNSEKLNSKSNFHLTSKIGFDSSTNHSRYNQRWTTPGQNDDDSMLLTSVNPLLLHHVEDGDSIVVWLNQRPSSSVYCRPLELEYIKETISTIREKAQAMENAIESLRPTIVTVENREIVVQHTVLTTMCDGKITSVTTDTSNQSCNVCKATPAQMNSIALLRTRECDSSAYRYGLSVLHANIRFLEYMLNLAYRLEIKKGYTKYTILEKQSMAKRKKNISQELKNEIGLLVDRPSSRGGNTNTGNVARRFFSESARVSQITGLNLDVLIKCRTVLRTISCGYAVDVEAFEKFAIETAELIVHEYPWYYMSSSVHTVLLHGAQFMKLSPLPIGMLSEEPLESTHKDVRYMRTHHSRKCSRQAGMEDILHGLLVRSDPIIASLRKAPKPKGQLPKEVLQLLLPPNADGSFPVLMPLLMEDSDSSDDDHCDD